MLFMNLERMGRGERKINTAEKNEKRDILRQTPSYLGEGDIIRI